MRGGGEKKGFGWMDGWMVEGGCGGRGCGRLGYWERLTGRENWDWGNRPFNSQKKRKKKKKKKGKKKKESHVIVLYMYAGLLHSCIIDTLLCMVHVL